VALTGGGSAGSVVGPDMMSWQAYQEPSADMSAGTGWGKAAPARQGKVEAAAQSGIRQQTPGPEWASEIADDSSPWKEV
jgi:hypothetical protein